MAKQDDTSTTLSQSSTTDALYNQSLKLLDDAIKECNLDGFLPSPLNIPQKFNANDSNRTTASQEPDFFSLANALFNQQKQLFSEQEVQDSEAQNQGLNDQDLLNQDLLNPNQLSPGLAEQAITPQEPSQQAGHDSTQPTADESLAAINDLLNSA